MVEPDKFRFHLEVQNVLMVEPRLLVGEPYKYQEEKEEVIRVPKFIALHTLPQPGEVEAAVPIAKKVKAYSTLDAYWVGTWVQLNKEGKALRFICEWNAKDAESVQKVFDRVPELPVDGIYPMAKLDSEDYR